MKRICDANNLPEAALLADLLEAAGISVHVLNQNAVGAMGDVPFLDALPQIWVANAGHAALAREIVERFRSAASAAPNAPWDCTGCGENNPGNFDVCWNCGAPVANLASAPPSNA
jgi:hypothetical protein